MNIKPPHLNYELEAAVTAGCVWAYLTWRSIILLPNTLPLAMWAPVLMALRLHLMDISLNKEKIKSEEDEREETGDKEEESRASIALVGIAMETVIKPLLVISI